MGHYDEQYEDHENQLRKQEAEDLKRWITQNLEQLDVYDLRLLHKMSKPHNMKDFQAFFRVIKTTKVD